MKQPLSRKDFLKMAAGGAGGFSIAATARADSEPALARELFFSSSIENGFTWTLSSRLGDMLALAEEALGPRDISYTILGVEIGPDIPRLWFPGNRRHVIVQLSPSAATDAMRAWYQLSHETVHLLAPTGGGPATNLEEAVACYFSAYYMKRRFGKDTGRPVEESYSRGLHIITPRLDEDIQCVKRLREKHPYFADIPKDHFATEFPGVAPADLDFLLQPFNRDTPER